MTAVYDTAESVFAGWDAYLHQVQQVITAYQDTQQDDSSTCGEVSQAMVEDYLGEQPLERFNEAWKEADFMKDEVIEIHRYGGRLHMNQHGRKLVHWYDELEEQAQELSGELASIYDTSEEAPVRDTASEKIDDEQLWNNIHGLNDAFYLDSEDS